MNNRTPAPLRGEVWRLKPDVLKESHADSGVYCVVVSANAFNTAGLDLVMGVPLSPTEYGMPLHISLVLPQDSTSMYAKCEELRCLPITALDVSHGCVEARVLASIMDRVRIILDL